VGQKVHPVGFRIGQKFTWQSRWFADGEKYKHLLLEDIKIRKLLMEKLQRAGIAKVEIERTTDRVHIRVFVVRPGVVIGRGGTGMEELKKFLLTKLKITDPGRLKVDVEEVSNPDLNAYLIAVWISSQLVRRIPHRRVMSRAIERVMSSGAKGVKLVLSGRIAGAEIARKEKLKAGTVPLQTLRAEIDYAHVPALTKYGYIGVKVWINRGT
jgi:small subunit ribosomal protein S3